MEVDCIVITSQRRDTASCFLEGVADPRPPSAPPASCNPAAPSAIHT